MIIIQKQEVRLGGSVKPLTLGFGSGHDLEVSWLCTDSAEPAWAFSFFLSAPPPLTCGRTLALSQTERKKKNRKQDQSNGIIRYSLVLENTINVEKTKR